MILVNTKTGRQTSDVPNDQAKHLLGAFKHLVTVSEYEESIKSKAKKKQDVKVDESKDAGAEE
jgi:hypothetical protein